MHDYLVENKNANEYCMAGFILKNTLSDNGGVTRGICSVDENGYLTNVVETHEIIKTATGAISKNNELDINSLVSMNMWGFTPDYLDLLEEGFIEFFDNISGNELKAEYLIPVHIGELLKAKKISVKVLKTSDKWFGVTYKEDSLFVKESFEKLIESGEYLENLFGDL